MLYTKILSRNFTWEFDCLFSSQHPPWKTMVNISLFVWICFFLHFFAHLLECSIGLWKMYCENCDLACFYCFYNRVCQCGFCNFMCKHTQVRTTLKSYGWSVECGVKWKCFIVPFASFALSLCVCMCLLLSRIYINKKWRQNK